VWHKRGGFLGAGWLVWLSRRYAALGSWFCDGWPVLSRSASAKTGERRKPCPQPNLGEFQAQDLAWIWGFGGVKQRSLRRMEFRHSRGWT
jgi:hypothetical protein